MSQAQHTTASFRLLVIYMISTLLFLTSIELHIHTEESAHIESHGHAVSISSLANRLDPEQMVDEISVSPDGLLKIQTPGLDVIAIFILLLFTSSYGVRYFRFLRERHEHIERPFYGTPRLRAPPR